MATINNGLYTILNKAIKQAWGSEAISVIDEQGIISLGNDLISTADGNSKDVWLRSITDQITASIFVNRELSGESLGLSVDTRAWNGITRKIRVKPVLLEKNSEYELGNEEFNPFKIVNPTVDEKVFSKFGTYAVEIFVPDNQLMQAFKSEGDMQAFFNLLTKQIEDAIRRGEWAYERLCLINFIGEKLHLQETQANKTHAINVLKLYNDAFNKQLDAADVYYDPDFLRFFSTIMIKYKKLMASETDIFNASEGYVSQTTPEYLRVFVANEIDSTLPAYLYSNTYHDEMVTLDGYKTVNYWQGIGDVDGFNAADTTSIHVNIASDGTEINQSGILAVMMDIDAAACFFKRDEAESWRVFTKGTKYHQGVTQSFINDMFENGVVFYVKNED